MAKQVFEGVKVVDFGWIVVGPSAPHYMAQHGATVVRIESMTRLDGCRLLAPHKDFTPGINRSGFFPVINDSKYGISLNLNHPKGPEVAKRLVQWADVAVEGMTTGTMKKWGLDYEELRKIKPDIIMISTCQQGQYGPHATYGGIGAHMSGLAGYHALVGWPDRDPAQVYGAYVDFPNCHLIGILVMAALDYRRRTGKGQYIDLSQLEGVLQFEVTPILDYTVNKRVLTRMGNRNPYAAPHGIYPCRGEDRWCAIAVSTDEEWQAFCQVIGNPEWTSDPKFTTFLARKQNEDDLDRLVAEWTANLIAEEVMNVMQAAGVAAGVVKTGEDLFNDPQLQHRNYLVVLNHGEIGPHSYQAPQFKLSKTPGEVRMPGPCLGEHNEYVYKELLGMSADEIADLMSEEVLQ